MIQIRQLKLPVDHGREDLKKKAAKALRVRPEEILELHVMKQSLDARKKPELFYIYTVNVKVRGEAKVLKKSSGPQILMAPEEGYRMPAQGSEPLRRRPVVVGLGPAGLFAGLALARAGFQPLILERGQAVEERRRKVDAFWAGGALDPESNVQFGEGGAGTFSDGKLNTLVKDVSGRGREVLRVLAEAGAGGEILWQQKPHIGTDLLCGVVSSIRKQMEELGGEVRFDSRVTDLRVEGAGGGRVTAVQVNGSDWIGTDAVILALGHSARDTFGMLHARGIYMEPRAFAVGLRIQHPQSMINESQYGREEGGALGAASYKVTYQASTGRGVYSFCMCPGGYVVNASSEPGRLAVNGMSNHARDGENANSALIVTVTPEDFGGSSPLAGLEFQRRLEERAYAAGGGAIPVQLLEDYKRARASRETGDVRPQLMGRWTLADLRGILPEAAELTLLEGIERFDRMIPGFGRPDALLAGVESRTSAPLKMVRGESFESRTAGLYPCGEGAGYAGGITSAAMDGLKVAEAVISRYRPEY